jgi:hypothetical protein
VGRGKRASVSLEGRDQIQEFKAWLCTHWLGDIRNSHFASLGLSFPTWKMGMRAEQLHSAKGQVG